MAELNQTKELLSIVLGVVFSFFFSRPLRIADVRVLGTARFAEGATKIDNGDNKAN